MGHNFGWKSDNQIKLVEGVPKLTNYKNFRKTYHWLWYHQKNFIESQLKFRKFGVLSKDLCEIKGLQTYALIDLKQFSW